MQLPSRFESFARNVEHRIDVDSRLSREAARDALARARMSLHEAALEMEEAVGGLVIADLQLGIGAIAKTHAATFAADGLLDRRSIAELAQIGYAQRGLPTRLWLDASGWIYAETALDRVVPVARSWQELVEIALRQRGDVCTQVHELVAGFSGWRLDDLIAALDLACPELPTGDRRVAWSTDATRICFGKAAPAVASTLMFADFARMALDAQILEPTTTLALFGATPSGTRQEASNVLGVVPTDLGRQIVFCDPGGEVSWHYAP